MKATTSIEFSAEDIKKAIVYYLKDNMPPGLEFEDLGEIIISHRETRIKPKKILRNYFAYVEVGKTNKSEKAESQ